LPEANKLQSPGIVNKFVGNSAHALFGLPARNNHEAENAIQSSLAIKKMMYDLNNRFEAEGFPVVKVGVGVSTQTVLQGVVGGGTYFEYTVVGDCMNTPERLQRLTASYGVPILVCEDTRRIIKDVFHTREIDMVRVKGRETPVVIFEVMGTAENDLAHDIMTVKPPLHRQLS
jgi:adenylate cyclase